MAPAAWTTRDIRCEGSELEISARFGILAGLFCNGTETMARRFRPVIARHRLVYFRSAV